MWRFLMVLPLVAASVLLAFERVLTPETSQPVKEILWERVSGDNSSVEGAAAGRVLYGFDKSPGVRVTPDISSPSYMVADPHTGFEILAHNADAPRPPASLTKIMTAFVVAKKLAAKEVELTEEAEVSPKVLAVPGSRMFIQPGLPVTLDQLLFGLIVSSGNDAALAIAEHISGSEEEFVSLMNQEAQLLGMRDCRFLNSNGLPHPLMRCSLRSLMILCKELIVRYPAFYKRYFGVRQFTYNGITQRSRNQLLFWASDEVDGIKTGNTEEAGYNVIVSGVREYRLIVGVMGAKSTYLRVSDASKLLNHVYVYYKRYIHYRGHEPISKVRVWKGGEPSVPVGLERHLYTTLPYRKREDFTTAIILPGRLRAPVVKNQVVGELVLTFQGGEILSRPLIALEAVKPAGLLKGFWHELLISFGG